MKKVNCCKCQENTVLVTIDFKFQFCCSGLPEMCGCYGRETNPVFCNECEEEMRKAAQQHKIKTYSYPNN